MGITEWNTISQGKFSIALSGTEYNSKRILFPEPFKSEHPFVALLLPNSSLGAWQTSVNWIDSEGFTAYVSKNSAGSIEIELYWIAFDTIV